MALSSKVKTALDETRTLILGAQILLGFQFNSVFRQRFGALSSGVQTAEGVALGIMVVTIGLLIAPSAYHRLVDRGESTGRMQEFTGQCAAAALLPFAIALGIDLAITLGQAFQSAAAGIAAGAGFALLAASAWYGVGQVMKRHHGHHERENARQQAGKRKQRRSMPGLSRC